MSHVAAFLVGIGLGLWLGIGLMVQGMPQSGDGPSAYGLP